MNEFLLEQQSVTGANNFTSAVCVCVHLSLTFFSIFFKCIKCTLAAKRDHTLSPCVQQRQKQRSSPEFGVIY